MRRIALMAGGVAVLAASFVLVEPMVGAATLKPGVPTKVKAAVVNHTYVPVQTGAVKVTWTAPKVVKGKTAKATSYFVQCGSVKATTTKTSVVLKNVAKAPKAVTCTVQAKAGKVSNKPVKANAVTVYTGKGAFVMALVPNLSAKVTSPGLNNAGAFLLPTAEDLDTTNALTIGSYGTLTIKGAALKNVTVAEDAASTNDNPIINVTATTAAGKTITVGQARDLNANNFMFTLYAPTDADSVAWYAAQGVTFTTSGQAIGAFTALGASEL